MNDSVSVDKKTQTFKLINRLGEMAIIDAQHKAVGRSLKGIFEEFTERKGISNATFLDWSVREKDGEFSLILKCAVDGDPCPEIEEIEVPFALLVLTFAKGEWTP